MVGKKASGKREVKKEVKEDKSAGGHIARLRGIGRNALGSRDLKVLREAARVGGVAADKMRLKQGAEKVVVIGSTFKQEVRKNVVTAVTAAFGFMIALTWRDAIKEIVESVLAASGIKEGIYAYKIVVALIITMICVFGIMIISRWAEKKGEKEEKEEEKKAEKEAKKAEKKGKK